MNFSIKYFFRKCDLIQRTADLVTFNEEILNGKLHFLCSAHAQHPPAHRVAVWEMQKTETFFRDENEPALCRSYNFQIVFV